MQSDVECSADVTDETDLTLDIFLAWVNPKLNQFEFTDNL